MAANHSELPKGSAEPSSPACRLEAARAAYGKALQAFDKAQARGAGPAELGRLRRALNEARAAYQAARPAKAEPRPEPPAAWQPPEPLSRRVAPAGGPWSIVVEDVDAPRHHQAVYLLREPGERVPPGPNLHARDKADAEAARLVRVLNWPKPIPVRPREEE